VAVTFDSSIPAHYGGVQSDALSTTDLHQPATFASRGVTVPFTTPLLTGGRVRQSKRTGTEFVVPNSSGGRGVYILLWPGVLELCNPTVHDRALAQRVSCLARIDPANVRGSALDVALEGYAGRKAAAAAEVARQSDHSRVSLMQSLLVAALIEQVEPTLRKATALAESMPNFERQAGLVLRRIAPAAGCSPAHLTIVLSAMGAAFASIGVERNGHTARVPRLIIRLAEARADIARWLLANPQNDMEPLGRALTGTMAGALDGAEAMLAQTRATLADPVKLLQSWIANPDDAAGLVARCDWLLDGWEHICLIWKIADSDSSRRAALLEMVQSLPVWPREVNDWFPAQIPLEAMNLACRVVSRNDAWRSGAAALAMIERNEALRAMSA
jgi:hypothetical protein